MLRMIIVCIFSLSLYAKPFKVATYNVENLFDASSQGTEYESYIPGKHHWDKKMVQTKLNHTAEVICDLNADVIGLQEIENSTIFGQLQRRLAEVGCSYRYSAMTHSQKSAIQVGLLSRYPIEKVDELKVGNGIKGTRNILEVQVKIENHPLIFFVNHWKSRAYDGYESKRIVYAKRLQSRISKMPQGTEYIIIGDLNSDYNVYATLEKKINDTDGKTALNDVLRTKVGKQLVTENDIVGAPSGVHYMLWQELPLTERWSMKYYGKTSTADQIILPSTLFDGQGIEYQNNSFAVFKPSYLFLKQGTINRWQYIKNKHLGKGYSDHLPIYAYFDTTPYKAAPKIAPKVSTIEELYTTDILSQDVMLQDVIVVLKRGKHALIKQRKQGRGIFLFGCAGDLQEGQKYDLRVAGITTYYGLKEITILANIEEKGEVNASEYKVKSDDFSERWMRQNEVVGGLVGFYKNDHFYWNGNVLPLYFKKKKIAPPNGSHLKIDYAHVGYYKKLQLVVYDKKDFTIVE